MTDVSDERDLADREGSIWATSDRMVELIARLSSVEQTKRSERPGPLDRILAA